MHCKIQGSSYYNLDGIVKKKYRQFEDRWTALIVSDSEAPPQPDQLKGIAFFGDTAEEADQQALDYLGMQVGRN